MDIRISIVFYFGIHILIVESNCIPNDGTDNSAVTLNKVNRSTSEVNTFDEIRDEIQMVPNRNFLNERNFNMTRTKMAKREIISRPTVGTITEDTDTDFRGAVTQGKLVVDKTRFIPKLLKFKSSGQFIMLRPYRFGKSFFLSMLKAFFEGDEVLFCPTTGRPKMDICHHTDFTWGKYPILSLNFLELGGSSIYANIRRKVVDLAKKYGCADEILPEDVNDLIEVTFTAIYNKEKKGVVVLVDEYDLPAMQTYFDDDKALFKLNEGMIQGFFSALKKCASYIHFALIFGATKVTTVGQTFNLLEDLTRSEEYSDMIGFTKEEIMKTYKERLEEIVCERKLEDIQEFFEKILHPYYNNYQFTRPGKQVFNPLSITKFLLENPENPKPYWAEKVHKRDFLKHTVEKFSNNTIHLLLGQNHPFKSYDMLNDELDRAKVMRGDTTELAKLFFQTGHMTITEPATSKSYCDLGVVNEEAKYLFERCLQQKVNEGPLYRMENMLQQYKFEEFIKALEDAIVDFLGNKHFKLEVKYEMIVGILLELRDQAPTDWKSAVLTSAMMKQFEIEKHYADYVKIMPFSKVTTIFHLKRYEPGRTIPNTTFELMKCHSAYVKPYADKYPENEVMCIVLIFYTGAGQRENLRNNPRVKGTNREFIMDWAALEWFREEKEVQEHNTYEALSDEQREEVAAYNNTNQKIEKQDLLKFPKTKPKGQIFKVSEYLIPAAMIFKGKRLLSLKEFTNLIERCKYPDKDAVKEVREFTEDTKGVIKLINECHTLVKNRWLQLRLTKIKNALQK